MSLFDRFKSSPSTSFSSKEEVSTFINAFAATKATLSGKLDSSGLYKGHVNAPAPEEIYEFLRYVAVTRGSAFESVQTRYGFPGTDEAFMAYAEFDTKEIDKTKGYIITICLACSARCEAPFNQAGRSSQCPSCGAEITIMMPQYKVSQADIDDFAAVTSPSFDLSNVYYKSSNHKRYNSGVWTGGDNQGCMRAIEIKPDTEISDSHFVTLYNLDGPYSQWGDNIQLATKRMKVVSESESEITLRGFGEDPMLAPGRPPQVQSNYGLTIHLAGQEDIDHISYYYHDRAVRMDFLPSTSISSEPDDAKDDSAEAMDWFMGKMNEYSQMMDATGEVEETTPEVAQAFRQAVVDRVGCCNFGIMEIMAIVDARRMIGKNDAEIIEDLIRLQD